MTTAGDSERQRRPGGRSARVKEAVFQAVLDTIVEQGENAGIPEISRRAGVRDSSIYRRWGTRDNLILDALLSASERTLPIPDTGSLATDLRIVAAALIDYLGSPLGQTLSRTFASVTDTPQMLEGRNMFWQTRYAATTAMVRRAIDRGEIAPDTDPNLVVELLVGPLHFRALITRNHPDEAYAGRLITVLMRALKPAYR